MEPIWKPNRCLTYLGSHPSLLFTVFVDRTGRMRAFVLLSLTVLLLAGASVEGNAYRRPAAICDWLCNTDSCHDKHPLCRTQCRCQSQGGRYA